MQKKKLWVHTEWISTDPNYHLCWYSFFVLKLSGENFKNITNDPVPKIPRNRYPKKRYLLGYYIQVPYWKSAVSRVSQVKYNSFICRNVLWFLKYMFLQSRSVQCKNTHPMLNPRALLLAGLILFLRTQSRFHWAPYGVGGKSRTLFRIFQNPKGCATGDFSPEPLSSPLCLWLTGSWFPSRCPFFIAPTSATDA